METTTTQAACSLDQDPASDVGATLNALGVTDPDDLIVLLDDPDDARAAQACWLVGHFRTKRHSLAVLRVLRGPRPALWMASAVALSVLESKRPTRGLIELTRDTTRPADQRYAATYALGFTSAALSDARHTDAIADAFMTVLRNREEPPHLRGVAAEGLGNLFGGCFGGGDRRAATYDTAGQLLITTLDDPEPEVRFWSAFALGALRYRAAVPALRRRAHTDTGRSGNWWTVGEEAADALDLIAGRVPPARTMGSA
jgi:HEAT repeat protein